MSAQSGAAELEIAVRDPAGLLVADATVKAVDEDRGRERSAVTGEDGRARLLGETVEVRADHALLETGRGGVATVVDEELVEGLPLDGRNFVPLVATLPGVALPRGSAFPRLNGSRPRTNEYIYDGVSVLQPEPGQVAYYPIIDAIEEFRVDLNSYSAEYGRPASG